MSYRHFIKMHKKGRIFFYMHSEKYVYIVLDSKGNEEWEQAEKYLEKITEGENWHPNRLSGKKSDYTHYSGQIGLRKPGEGGALITIPLSLHNLF